MTMITINNLTKTFNNSGVKTRVFRNLNLKIKDGEFVSIIGPNGVGKTTLLNIISGLTTFDSGEVAFPNAKTNRQPRVGFVLQNYQESLFPWLTSKNNITFPLDLIGSKIGRKNKIKKLCRMFKANFSLDKYPYELSGGQQQLVVLMRNTIIEPDVYLFDEPFSSLDYKTTLTMLKVVMNMWMKTKTTTVFVSHDIDSAIFLSQKIFILKGKPAKIICEIKNSTRLPREIIEMGSKRSQKIKRKILEIYNPETSMNQICQRN